MYGTNNCFQYLSKLHRPFATGMFMLVETATFRALGRFHEQVHFAEDYLLSSQTDRKKFAIVRGGALHDQSSLRKNAIFAGCTTISVYDFPFQERGIFSSRPQVLGLGGLVFRDTDLFRRLLARRFLVDID